MNETIFYLILIAAKHDTTILGAYNLVYKHFEKVGKKEAAEELKADFFKYEEQEKAKFLENSKN